ncbi:tetratricopeptide repeat protein [Nostoc sp.]
MDWITTLRAQQADFIERLKSGCLLYCEKEGQHSELTVISGERLERLRHFCWQMAEKYKKTSSVRDVFINNLKGKLGEEVVKDRLAKLVTEIDYEKRLSGDGKVDFTLNYNPSVGIQVKARHGSIDTVKWWISKEEIEKNTILVCILIQESVNEAQPKYNLVSAGFLPTSMIDVTNSTASLGIDALLYISGLHSYISSLNSPKDKVILPANEFTKDKVENEQTEDKKDINGKYIEHQTISLVIDYLLLGNSCLEQYDYQGALVNYNQVLQLNPNIADAYLGRACTRCKLGDIQGAKDDFKQAILINPVDAQLYFNRGSFHYDTGNINDAIEDYNQGIKINNNNFYAFFMRGNIYYEIGNVKAAIEDYTQSLRINPKSPEAYFNRGFLYYQTRETQKAIEDFTEAISIDNKKTEAYFWRGIARYDRRIDKGAIIDFTQVIKLDPNQASAYVRRGIVFVQIREYEKAIEDFDSALIINPNFAEAYENRGAVYHQLGHMPYAIRDLQKAANFYDKQDKDENYQRVLDMLRQIYQL